MKEQIEPRRRRRCQDCRFFGGLRPITSAKKTVCRGKNRDAMRKSDECIDEGKDHNSERGKSGSEGSGEGRKA